MFLSVTQAWAEDMEEKKAVGHMYQDAEVFQAMILESRQAEHAAEVQEAEERARVLHKQKKVPGIKNKRSNKSSCMVALIRKIYTTPKIENKKYRILESAIDFACWRGQSVVGFRGVLAPSRPSTRFSAQYSE